MPHHVLRTRRPRTPLIPRPLALRAAGTLLAAAGLFPFPLAGSAIADG
jgi:hypothetical protein